MEWVIFIFLYLFIIIWTLRAGAIESILFSTLIFWAVPFLLKIIKRYLTKILKKSNANQKTEKKESSIAQTFLVSLLVLIMSGFVLEKLNHLFQHFFDEYLSAQVSLLIVLVILAVGIFWRLKR